MQRPSRPRAALPEAARPPGAARRGVHASNEAGRALAALPEAAHCPALCPCAGAGPGLLAAAACSACRQAHSRRESMHA